MSLPMTATPKYERPRERLLTSSAEALTERELLALLLRSGTRGMSAIDLGGALLAEYGSLRAIGQARPEELASRTGIGVAKAASLVAAFELGRRADHVQERIILQGPEDVARVARRALEARRRERVLALVCDSANRLQRVVTVSEGSMDRCIFPVREILNAVLRHDGRAFAVSHNHPSLDPSPSVADRQATAQIRDGARVVGVRFLCHVIVGGDRFIEVS